MTFQAIGLMWMSETCSTRIETGSASYTGRVETVSYSLETLVTSLVSCDAVRLELGDDRLGAAHQGGRGGHQARVAGLDERAGAEGLHREHAGAGERDRGGQQAQERHLGPPEDHQDRDQRPRARAQQRADGQQSHAVDQVALDELRQPVGQARVLQDRPGALLVDVLQGDAEAERGVVGVEGERAERARVHDGLARQRRPQRHAGLDRADLRLYGAAEENAQPRADRGRRRAPPRPWTRATG